MDVALRVELDDHLAGCEACRQFEAELRRIQGSLARLPALPLSDEALAEVWRRTSRAPAGRPGRSRGVFDWRVAAAAAVLTLGLLGTWWVGPSRPVPPTDHELALAAREARMVLGVTAGALRRAERATVKGVLEDEVAPALRSVPIQWPDVNDRKRRTSNDDV